MKLESRSFWYKLAFYLSFLYGTVSLTMKFEGDPLQNGSVKLGLGGRPTCDMLLRICIAVFRMWCKKDILIESL